MKKILFISLIFTCVAAIFLINFFRSLGVSNPASLVSADTFIFATTPDLLQTAMRWPSTSLAKIIAEPDVKEFLKKPLSFFRASSSGQEASGRILEVKPRKIFLAVEKFSVQETVILLGFQFLGTERNVLNSWELIRKKLMGEAAVITSRSTTSYNSHAIETIVYENITFYSAVYGRWGFFSNHLRALQDTLDRAAGKNSTPSLSQTPDYEKVNKHLPQKPDFHVFVNSKSTLQALLAFGSSMGNEPDPSQIQLLQKLGSLGISSKLEGDNIHDTIAVLVSDLPEPAFLQHIAMPFTRVDTLGYLETSTEWHSILRGSLFFLGKFLKQPAFFAEEFHQIFGPELGCFFSWPAVNLRPPTILAIGIKNPAAAPQYLHRMGFDPLLPHANLPKTALYQLELPQHPLFTPTIALQDKILLAGLTTADVGETLSPQVADPSGTTLEGSPAFAPALSRYHARNILFSFLNSRALFERAYSILRPVIIFSAALTSDFIIDPSKLPPAESISKHLHPIVSTQQLQEDVCTFDSVGPITLGQALLALFFTKTKIFPSL